MPTLRKLEGRLLRCEEESSSEQDATGKYPGMWVFRGEDGEVHMRSPTPKRWTFRPVDTVGEAHGMRFLCPKSWEKNGGSKGTHSVYIFFTGSPYAGHNAAGEEVRWQVVGGTTLEDLALTPSIQEQDEGMPPEHQCNWHGFVGSSGVPPGSAA